MRAANAKTKEGESPVMNLMLKKVLVGLLCGGSICSAFSASVDWNKAFVVYEGVEASGVYERYTMGSPYLNMVAKRKGSGLEIWAQPEANLVAANTFVLLDCALTECLISPESIYSAPEYFAYAVYKGSVGEYEERADYSVIISPEETIYLGFASQSSTLTEPITCGWVELGLDGEGRLTVIQSAWDRDGDPIRVGATPEPSSALLLLVGGALLALRRRRGSPGGGPVRCRHCRHDGFDAGENDG